MIVALTLIGGWLFAGWLGWRLLIPWWTEDYDMKRRDRNFFQLMIIFGPPYFLVALILYIGTFRRNRGYTGDEIIYPRKEFKS